MSTSIDERVVSMQFDNKQFESNAKTSMTTLERLKEKLNFSGAAKGLENVNSAAKNINMAGLSSAVETVQAKFSALQVMAITALANITNSAVNAGKRIASALTIDPLKSGFQEYETQINAVQTILANTQSKGTTLDQVNAALDELNLYADKTIYNFTEMTRNIGTFTAAGVDLETSVSAIQGIANLAAVSGSTSQQASTAMYQLSQALASGTVKLMDWNSVVNAGMGGQVFQDALKETARLHGVAIDQMIKDAGSFRETLKNEWLTSDILTETLSKFTTSGVNEYLEKHTKLSADAISKMREQAIATGNASAAYKEMAKQLAESSDLTSDQIYELLNMSTTAEDAATKVKTFTQLIDTTKEAIQSGWTQTWEIIIGDFEEAKALWTEISDVLSNSISKSAEARNNLLEGALGSKWSKFTEQITEAGVTMDEFQTKLGETAKEHGKDLDKLIEEYGSLEKVISSGAMSTDIIVQTLKNLAGLGKETEDLTGKLEDFQAVVDKVWSGSYGVGADRIKALTDAGYDYAKVQELVNKTVDGHRLTLEDLSDTQLESIGYTEEQITAIRKLADEADKSGTPLNKLIEDMQKPSGRELLIDSIRNAFEGLSKVVKRIKIVFRQIFPRTTSEQLYGMIEAVHSFSEKLANSQPVAIKLGKAFRGLFSVVDILRMGFIKIVDALKPLAPKVGGVASKILELSASFGDWLFQLRNSIKSTGSFVEGVRSINDSTEAVATRISNLSQLFTTLYESFKAKIVTPGLDALSDILDRLKERFSGLIEVVTSLSPIFSNAFSSIGEAIKSSDFMSILQALFDGVVAIGAGLGKAFSGLLTSLTGIDSGNGLAGFFDILNSIITGGIGVGIIKFLKSATGTFENFAGIGESITGVLDGVKGCLAAYQSQLKSDILLKLAEAIAILAVSLLVLASIDSEKLTASLGAITAMFGDLMASMAILNQLGSSGKGSVKKAANLSVLTGAIIGMSVAILILSVAVKKLANLKLEDLAQGMIGVVVLVGMVAAVAKRLSENGPLLMESAAAMIMYAYAVKILTSSVMTLSELSWEELIKGLVGVGALLGAIIGFTKLIENPQELISTGIGMILVSTALVILASVAKQFAILKWEELIKGLVGVGALLGAIIGFTKLIENPQGLISTGIGMILVSTALVILASVAKQFAILKWEEIDKGLTGIGGSLLILAVALDLMRDTLSGAAALIIAAGALAIIAPVILLLGKMELTEIGKGLLAIAGVFGILGVSALLLAPLVPVIIMLTGAITLLGVGILSIGGGLMLAAMSIGIFATALSAGATAIAAGLTIVVTSVLSLIPFLIIKIGEGIVIFATMIAAAAPVIGQAIVVVITTIVLTILKLANNILSIIAEYGPSIISSVLDILIGLCGVLIEKIPELVDVAIQLMVAFIYGLADGLDRHSDEIIGAVGKLFKSLLKIAVQTLTGGYGLIGKAVKWLLNTALVQKIIGMFSDAKEAVGELIDNAKSAIYDMLPDWAQAGWDMIDGLIQGIKDAASGLWDAAVETVSDAWQGVKDWLGINSPSTEYAKLGRYSDEGMIVGLKKYAGGVSEAAKDVGEGALNSMSDALSRVSDIIDSDMDMTPTIRPVIDLTDVENGNKRLSSIFGSSRSITVDSARIKASKLAGDISSSNADSATNQNGPSFSFTQNNYSPKALSQIDIYRQTKNQFSAMKGVLSKA